MFFWHRHVTPLDVNPVPTLDLRRNTSLCQAGAVQPGFLGSFWHGSVGIQFRQLQSDKHLHPGTSPWMSGKKKWKREGFRFRAQAAIQQNTSQLIPISCTLRGRRAAHCCALWEGNRTNSLGCLVGSTAREMGRMPPEAVHHWSGSQEQSSAQVNEILSTVPQKLLL